MQSRQRQASYSLASKALPEDIKAATCQTTYHFCRAQARLLHEPAMPC